MRKAFTIFFVLLSSGLAQSREYSELWQDPEVEQRIELGIRANRMGFATFRFVDAQGQPVTNVEVEINQITHDFLFGCNIFFLDGFPDPVKNRLYEEKFKSLFNFATAPFYWSDLEPEPGKPRFGVDSPAVFRRPPPDAVLEFCRRNGILVKGHPLLWHQFLPRWLPDDHEEVAALARQRISQIAGRYGHEISIWDVVNEPLERPAGVILPPDYVQWGINEAGRAFPPDTTLLVNEVTTHWLNFRHETSPFYLLLGNLLLRGAPLKAIGLQFHLFSERTYEEMKAGKLLRPLDLLQVLNRYADFALPIHITEITIPTLPNTEDGRISQARVARDLYRLWFSHPRVEAITWWNLADGTAIPRENKWGGGLLNEDLSAKPVFEALHKLIREEWHTTVKAESGPRSAIKWQGFYGRYTVTARHGQETSRREIHVGRRGFNEFEIRFRDGRGE